MQLKQLERAPKFKKDLPFGQVYSSGEGGFGAAMCQNGHYFRGDGAYIGSDENAKSIGRVEEEEAPREQNDRVLNEAEIPELMNHPQAAELMKLPLESLRAMVARCGGPTFSGDRAMDWYSAWLIKFAG